MSRDVRQGTQALLLHGARLGVSIGALAAAVVVDAPVVAAVATVALFLAGFAANHDALHGSLGLPRPVRDVAMALLGATMLLSGHAIRVMHLRHHARPLQRVDLEGIAAKMSLVRALVASPRLTLSMRLRGYARASRRDKVFILAETAANVITAVALLASGVAALHAMLVTLFVMQLAMPIWAGRIPHRTPAWLLRLARAMSFTRSATVLSLAYHEEHHGRPRVPCHLLSTLDPAR